MALNSKCGMTLSILLLTGQVWADTTRHTLKDEFGFERPVDAFTLTAPADWLVRGSVQWYGQPSCALDQMKIHFKATAGDGKTWVELIPGGAWSWSSLYDVNPQLTAYASQDCQLRRITSIQPFVQEYLPTLRPGAELVSSRPRPDLVQQAVAEGLLNLQLPPGQQPRLEIMDVRLRYHANGHTVHELLQPAVLFVDSQLQDPYTGGMFVTTTAWAMGTGVVASVEGEADEALLKSIGESAKFLPEYEQRLTRLFRDKARAMAQANARRRAAQQAALAARRQAHQTATRQFKVDTTGSEILDIQQQTYNNTSAMRAAGQAKQVDAIHERTPWLNASGQSIYMPSQYQRAYQLQDGSTYVGTNDAFFNPVQSTGQFAQPLQQAPYN